MDKETLLSIIEEAQKDQQAAVQKYEDADDSVIDVATTALDRFPELEQAKAANVKYLFRNGSWNKLGECSRATGRWRHLTGYDYVVTVQKEFWSSASEKEQMALMHHELMHIMKNEKTEKWALRRHDVEEFLETYKRFGSWKPELEAMSMLQRGDLTDDPGEREADL